MLNWLRQWIIRWLASRDNPLEFSFPGSLRKARRVLVLMPSQMEAFHQAEYFLARLPQAFNKARITLLYAPRTLAPRFYSPQGCQVIVPQDKDVRWLGFPRRAFVDKLFEHPFDVLITLDKSPSVFYAAVAVASGTPMRIGLPDGMGRPFVTIELRHGREAADAKTEFILFIEMIRNLAIEPDRAGDVLDRTAGIYPA